MKSGIRGNSLASWSDRVVWQNYDDGATAAQVACLALQVAFAVLPRCPPSAQMSLLALTLS